MQEMTPAMRRALKAQAHAIKPVVTIGNDGLTPAVLAEIERALKSHQLIKVRVLGDNREARRSWLADACAHTGARAVQHIGKILVIHRANPEPESVPPAKSEARSRPRPSPRPSPETGGHSGFSSRAATRTSEWIPPGRKRKAASPTRTQRPLAQGSAAATRRTRPTSKTARRRPY